jgi:hypothetical protein
VAGKFYKMQKLINTLYDCDVSTSVGKEYAISTLKYLGHLGDSISKKGIGVPHLNQVKDLVTNFSPELLDELLDCVGYTWRNAAWVHDPFYNGTLILGGLALSIIAGYFSAKEFYRIFKRRINRDDW